MDINELKKREEQRLKQFQMLREEESKERSRHRKQGKIALVIVCVLTFFFVEIIWANGYVASFWKDEILENTLERTIILSRFPGGTTIIDWRIREYCKKTVKDFNKDNLPYEKAMSVLACYYKITTSKKTSALIDGYEETLLELKLSKAEYRNAVLFEEQENYIQAMDAYQKVLKTDQYYSAATKNIKNIKNKYKDAIISKAFLLIAAKKDYNFAQQLFEQAAVYFPKDKTIAGYKQAGEDCGNPLIYTAVDVSCDRIKTFEKDKNHTKAECNALQLYAISDTEFILSASFHLDSPPGCYFYYKITADGTWEELSGTDFSNLVTKKNISYCADVEWNKEDDSEEKMEKLYSGFTKLGPSYDGEREKVSLSEIEENNTEMEERVSEKAEINIGAAVILQLAAVVIVFLIIKHVLKEIFG